MEVTGTDRTPPLLRDDAALFLDVDGTLTHHAPTPEAVVLDARVAPVLAHLQSRLGGALALVTGRSLVALDALMHPWVTPHAAGLHGLQTRPSPAGAERVIVGETWVAEAHAIADQHPGARVEAHGPCLYLHWRAAPEAAAAFTRLAHRIAEHMPSHRLHVGAHGIEIRPHGMDKGKAISAFMTAAPFAGRVPVFAGDDPADEPGFAAVNALGGVSILVGPERESAARFALRDATAVLAWLEKSGAEHFKENYA